MSLYIRIPALTIYCGICSIAHSQDAADFPNGVEREWTTIRDTTFTGTLTVKEEPNRSTLYKATNYSVSIKGEDTRTTSISLEDGYQHRWHQLHPKDVMWIRDALEWRTYGKESLIPLSPAQFLDPENDLPRNTLVPGELEPLKQSASNLQSAIARFALWWDEQNYLPISKRGDIGEKYVDFTRGFERHFNSRNESTSDFEEVSKAMIDLFQKEYDQPVILATKEIPYCPPETLAHYTQGRQATILRLTSFRDTRREYSWNAALLSASEKGRVELEITGNHVIGQLKEIDRSERMVDKPAGGAWEIEILNREQLEIRGIDENVRFFIDPYWANGLWVFKPYPMTGKEHLSIEAPFIMPPPVAEAGPIPEAPLTDGVTNFQIRTEWKPSKLEWDKPLQTPRKWTRSDGKSLTGDYRGFFNFRDRIITIATPQKEYPVAMNSLVKADHTFVAFAACDAAPYPIESGRLVYELRESKEKASRIELAFSPGKIEAKIAAVDDSDTAETKSFLEKATSLVTTLNSGFEVDYTTLTFKTALVGGEGKIEAASLLGTNGQTELICGLLKKSAPATHLDLPCRLIDIKTCSEIEQSLPDYLYQIKMAKLGTPEVALFWELFTRNSDFSEQLAPFLYFFKLSGSTSLIPMDVIAQHKTEGEAIRLQLIEAEIDGFSNP